MLRKAVLVLFHKASISISLPSTLADLLISHRRRFLVSHFSLFSLQEKRQEESVLGVQALADWLSGHKTREEAMAELLEKAESEELAPEKERVHARDGLYIALLSARYSLLNAELGASRRENAEVVQLLDKERTSNRRLKREAVIASSEMIRVQREHLAEATRVQAVLTEEQKATLAAASSSSETHKETKANNNHASASEEDHPHKDSTSSEAETTSSAAEDDDPDHCEDESSSSTRLVSTMEWDDLQKELSRVRALLGVGAGDSVVGSDRYRQLQAEVIEEKKARASVQKAADRMRDELKEEAKYRREVEDKWNERAEQHKAETEKLQKAVQEQGRRSGGQGAETQFFF